MATFRERPEIRWPQDTRYNVSDAAFFVDDDGFKYDVYKYISPDDGNATVGIIEKRSPADAHVTTWEVTPRAGWKIASLGSFWTEGGMAMRLYIYDLAISGSRPNSRETVVVPVGFNGNGLLAEAGGATTFLPDEESGGGGVTREEVEQVVRAELPRYFDPKISLLVENMKAKSKAAIREEGVLTETNGRDYFYQFFKDRLYEVFVQNVPGFWEWLREKVGGGEGPVEPTEPTEGGGTP